MNPNGSGTIKVIVIADAEIVKAAPGLKGDIRVDDLVALPGISQSKQVLAYVPIVAAAARHKATHFPLRSFPAGHVLHPSLR